MLEWQMGVPIPPKRNASAGTRRRHKWPLEAMPVGAVLFDVGRELNSVSAYISRASKEIGGRKFVVRPVWVRKASTPSGWDICDASAEGATEGVGVWRVE